MLLEIGDKIINNNECYFEQRNSFILYDSVAIDNMALTQQYIRALIAWNVKLLYIVNDDKKTCGANDIIAELKLYDKAEIFIVSAELSQVDKINAIHKKISEFKPKTSFLHIDTDDVVGVTVWNKINSSTKYFINHSDHTFWVGTKCADYTICFRSMGVNASVKYRGIEKKKLLLQPFYPIIKKNQFQGLPTTLYEHSVKLFSGGRFIKIYGENEEYFNMITKILNENPQAIMIFAGSGDDRALKKYIKKNNLEERWLVIKYRKDLVEILENIDIYIGTYPINGGLMINYAAICKKPILERDPMNGLNIDELLPKLNRGTKISFNKVDEYYAEAARLIIDEKYRKEKGENIFKAMVSPEEFNCQLKEMIANCRGKYTVSDFNIDLSKIKLQALECENSYLHFYSRLMLNNIIFKNSKVFYFKNLFIYLRYNLFRKTLDFLKINIKK